MEALLKCEVSSGQFTQEASVRLTNYNGEELSLFVPRCDVQFNGKLSDEWGEGLLRVEILDQKEGFSLVYLPGQTFNNGQTITVDDRQLVSDGANCAMQAIR